MLALTAALAFCTVILSLQPPQTQEQVPVTTERPEQPQPGAPPAPDKKEPAAAVKRWVDWQTGTVETRYRWVETTAGVETSDSLQHKQSFKAGFKFDEQGRYSVQALAGTGSSFVGSWDNLGPGIGDPAWTFNLRQLYLQARPVDGLDASWGGMAIARGEHTEITSFDNDNYVMAGRVSVKRPEMLHLDELSVTAGFLGDLSSPSVFERFDRWDEHNYTQILAAKKFGSTVSLSADWTDLNDVSTLRQAVRLSTKQWLPVDAIRFENYQRIEGIDGWGYVIAAERSLHPRVTLTGGFADIDENNGTLTGDRYFRGRRLFVEPKFTLLPELTVSLFLGEAVGNDFPVVNEHRFDVVVQYNVLKALQNHGAW
jgi:hypothetical protein